MQLSSDVQAQVIEIQKEFKFRVYHDLYDQGYYVLNGSKYGADFAIYSGNKFAKNEFSCSPIR